MNVKHAASQKPVSRDFAVVLKFIQPKSVHAFIFDYEFGSLLIISESYHNNLQKLFAWLATSLTLRPHPNFKLPD